MKLREKSNLLTLTYYTLVLCTISLSALFVWFLLTQTDLLYAQIVYIVWTIGAVAIVLFDILCTKNNQRKYIVGILVYILFILAMVMSVLTFMSTNVGGILIAEALYTYLGYYLLSSLITVMAILVFWVGQNLIKTENR